MTNETTFKEWAALIIDAAGDQHLKATDPDMYDFCNSIVDAAKLQKTQ